jgi:hypothetical protein
MLIVDNATTHTAKEYTIMDFSMKPGTKCPVEKITWLENDVEKSLNCFDQNKTSKRLLAIGRELGLV